MTDIGADLVRSMEQAANGEFAAVWFHGKRYVPENPWQPIETAPKDGCEILAVAGVADMPIYWIVFWNERDWECVASAAEVNVHHWMPLPSPPR